MAEASEVKCHSRRKKIEIEIFAVKRKENEPIKKEVGCVGGGERVSE